MTDQIKSASRVLDMLELFSTRCDGLTLTEVSKGLALPKSSTLGLLRTLHSRGYIVREADDLYRLNDIVRRDGFARHGRLLRVAPPVMRALADEIGETVILGMMGVPGMIRLIAKEVASREVRFDIDLPRQEPAYCTAMGRMLLAAQDDVETTKALAAVPPRKLTDATIIDETEIRARIADARKINLAIVEDEMVLGATGIAMRVPLSEHQPLAAINVGCVTPRFLPQRERIVDALRKAAAAIGDAMQPDRAA